VSGPIVVIGDVMVDVVVRLSGPIAAGSDTPAEIVQRGGGAAANVAAWLARSGAAAILVGRVGDDARGRAVMTALRDEGVDVRVAVDPQRPTGTCVVLVAPDGERSMLPDRGANAALAPTPLTADAAHVHVAGYALLDPGARPAALAALAAAREAGIPTSVDPASAAPLAAARGAFLGWIDGVDLLLPNADEATVLTGAADPVEAARVLSESAREVVVTLGGAGALWTDGTALVRVPAVPTDVVDTTGAGDAFTAGLLAAWLADPDGDPACALDAGLALAAEVVGRAGAR
jgi:sugar/nucleoside kinase (ribokinase family)